MALAKSFTAVGVSLHFLIPTGRKFTYDVSGTFVGTVVIERMQGEAWVPILAPITTTGSGTVTVDPGAEPRARFRIRCSAYTSGTIVTTLTEVTSDSIREVRDEQGRLLQSLSKDGAVLAGALVGPVFAVERTFTETSGAGTYTGSVVVPAGATILDIIVNGVALWNNAGACTMKVGDTDDDGFYTGVDLKATDLLAGESISFALAGGKAGAYIANSQVSPRYSATARTVAGIITTASTGGSTGRTRMTVVYHLPNTDDIVAATKV